MSREIVEFVSVWDGDTEIESVGTYNTETKEVSDIKSVDVGEELETLDEQYIMFQGEKLIVEWDEEKKGYFTV